MDTLQMLNMLRTKIHKAALKEFQVNLQRQYNTGQIDFETFQLLRNTCNELLEELENGYITN